MAPYPWRVFWAPILQLLSDGDILFQKLRIISFSFLFLFSLFLPGCGGSEETKDPGRNLTASSKNDIPMSVASESPSSGDNSGDRAAPARTTIHTPLLPEASGTLIYENEVAFLDASQASRGYILLDYKGSAQKIKLQIKLPDGTVYSYPLKQGRMRSFPLPGGSGTYQISVLEHAYDDLYALSFSQEITAALEDEFLPFLYPNQFSWYDASSGAVLHGISLSEQSSSDSEYLEQVYLWVTKNISYDNEKAASIASDYVPDVDETLSSGKGICFDYAALMVAMLRSQNIPTKLEVGYSGQVYHAWISVYMEEHGWLDNVIEFNGNTWTLLDPTLAANNDKDAVSEYIGDGSNYTVKYHY